jgi:hypothetical protein
MNKNIIRGEYISLKMTKNGLEISLTKKGKEKVKEDGITEENFYDYFEDIQANSEFLYFAESPVGLTDAPVITDGLYYDDDGELTDKGHSDSEVYWYPDYAIKSFADELKEEGNTFFDKSEQYAKGGNIKSKNTNPNKLNKMTPKLKSLHEDLKQLEATLKIASPDEKALLQGGIDSIKADIAKEEAKGSKPAPVKKTASKPKAAKKSTKKVKAAPKAKAPAKAKVKKPDCDELAKAWDKRRSTAKTAANKKTKSILERAADKMEDIVHSAVAYNKDKGGEINVEELKKAVAVMVKALDALKDALKGEFEDTHIDNFKADMNKFIVAAEKTSKK